MLYAVGVDASKPMPVLFPDPLKPSEKVASRMREGVKENQSHSHMDNNDPHDVISARISEMGIDDNDGNGDGPDTGANTVTVTDARASGSGSTGTGGDGDDEGEGEEEEEEEDGLWQCLPIGMFSSSPRAMKSSKVTTGDKSKVKTRQGGVTPSSPLVAVAAAIPPPPPPKTTHPPPTPTPALAPTSATQKILGKMRELRHRLNEGYKDGSKNGFELVFPPSSNLRASTKCHDVLDLNLLSSSDEFTKAVDMYL